jgi:hypothetical protein
MHVLLLGPQVLIWFSAAYLFGVGGFWMSFVETLPTASIPATPARSGGGSRKSRLNLRLRLVMFLERVAASSRPCQLESSRHILRKQKHHSTEANSSNRRASFA